ncbi:MAG TPA: hypothetical protein VF525_03130 [Pyrinomonadaceae bacterium]|jgi:hypothetical protein
MTRKLLTISLSLLCAVALYAQDKKNVKLTGYLIDNMCASHHAEDADFAEEVKGHSVKCALMPGCESSGFAVVADGKLYKFDDAGNKSATELLHSTKTKKGMQVAVEGTLEGDTLHVAKLSEVTKAE